MSCRLFTRRGGEFEYRKCGICVIGRSGVLTDADDITDAVAVTTAGEGISGGPSDSGPPPGFSANKPLPRG